MLPTEIHKLIHTYTHKHTHKQGKNTGSERYTQDHTLLMAALLHCCEELSALLKGTLAVGGI